MDYGPTGKDMKVELDGPILKMNGLRIPDPELKERTHRRRFPHSYKLEILREADRILNLTRCVSGTVHDPRPKASCLHNAEEMLK